MEISVVDVKSIWMEREDTKLKNGTYKPLPKELDDMPRKEEHFVHLSESSPGLLAYTPDEKYGELDKHKRTSVEGYVNKYFPKQVKPEQIKAWTKAITPPERYVLEFFSKPKEISTIYQIRNFDSCMKHPPSDFSSYPHHPSEAYGDSDIQICVMIDNNYVKEENTSLEDLISLGAIKARCLVYPEKKLRSRIYSSGGGSSDKLAELLNKQGYKHDDFNGAKLRIIKNNKGNVIAPYLDCGRNLKIHGEFMMITQGKGEYGGKQTNGLVGDPQHDYSCASCNGFFWRDEDGKEEFVTSRNGDQQRYCKPCFDANTYVCKGTGKTYDRNKTKLVQFGGNKYSEHYIHYMNLNFNFCEKQQIFTKEDIVPVLVYDNKGKSYEIESWAFSQIEGNVVVNEDYFPQCYVEKGPYVEIIDKEGNPKKLPELFVIRKSAPKTKKGWIYDLIGDKYDTTGEVGVWE